ncbi:hypothetical protein [Celeribacter ethanolicus]|nr:hypothetical protein [Celeribacter ethanolicus]
MRRMEEARIARWVRDKGADIFKTRETAQTAYSVHQMWTCRDCKGENERFLDEVAGHLESVRMEIPFSCIWCGGKDTWGSSVSYSGVSPEALAYWIAHEDEYFLSQDEDLILAEYDTQALLEALELCEPNETRSAKGLDLVSALLVQFRDGDCTVQEEPILREWLTHNRERWDHNGLWEYLREDVIRKLGS